MWRKHLAKFMRRPLADKWLFLQAFWLLGIARVLINFIPFRRLANRMGQAMAATAPKPAPQELEQVRRVAWAVRNAAHITPWNSNCFPQALAAKFLLRRWGIASTLYLGAAFADKESLKAHAWLRCGPKFVTGRSGHRQYKVVATFT
jgi:hypothetical protein